MLLPQDLSHSYIWMFYACHFCSVIKKCHVVISCCCRKSQNWMMWFRYCSCDTVGRILEFNLLHPAPNILTLQYFNPVGNPCFKVSLLYGYIKKKFIGCIVLHVKEFITVHSCVLFGNHPYNIFFFFSIPLFELTLLVWNTLVKSQSL